MKPNHGHLGTRLWLFAVVLIALGNAPAHADIAPIDHAILISVGEIKPPLARKLRVVAKAAKDAGVKTVVLHIDSPGGYVSEAQALVNAMRDSGLAYVACVRKGISAALWPILQADVIYMEPGASMGGAEIYTDDQSTGNILVDEKFNSILEAEIRSLAESKNYPVDFVMKMVVPEKTKQTRTSSKVVWADRYTASTKSVTEPVRQVATHTGAECVEAKLAKAEVARVDALLGRSSVKVRDEMVDTLLTTEWFMTTLDGKVFSDLYTPEVLSQRIPRGKVKVTTSTSIGMTGRRISTSERAQSDESHQRDRDRFENRVVALQKRLRNVSNQIAKAVDGGKLPLMDNTDDETDEKTVRTTLTPLRGELTAIRAQFDDMTPYMAEKHAEVLNKAFDNIEDSWKKVTSTR